MARSQLTKLKSNFKFWLTILLGGCVVATVAIAFHHFNGQTILQNTLLWLKNLDSTGILAFILIYNLATILFIPASLLTLGGGALYGVVWGTVYVLIAATLGAIATFALGRYVARNWVCQQIRHNPKFRAIDKAVANEGLKIVLLTRLSPIFPFNLLNYIFGITRVSLKDYVLGSMGMIPGTIMYVYIGALAGDITRLGMPQTLTSQAQLTQWLIKTVGFLATVAVTVYTTRLAKKALNQTIAFRDSRYDTFD